VQKTINEEGGAVSYSVWKCETFLFDVLKFTKKTNVILYPREDVYSPLKNASGEASLQAVQYDLLNWDRKVYEKVTGVDVSQKTFELDPVFYYPTDALCRKWKGRTFPDMIYVADKEMTEGVSKISTLIR
jgi:UDP-N-acetylglucosamine/UDP-N-acetylgalactosamine diphosphorylase